MASDDAFREPAAPTERLNVSQRLIDLIEQQFPGTLTRVGNDYDWTTSDGRVIRLSVRPVAEFPTKLVDPST